MRHRLTLPFFVNAAIIAAGAIALGKNMAVDYVAPNPQTIVQQATTTRSYTTTRTITKKVRGRIIRLPGGERVVHVPLIIVRTDDKTIRVPAHNLPITRLGNMIVARPLVPVAVTVYLPSDPATATVTATEQLPASTTTVTLQTTITVSVPFPPTTPTTSDQGGTTDGDGLHRPLEREQRRRLQSRSHHSSLPQGQRRHHLHRHHLPHPPKPRKGGGR